MEPFTGWFLTMHIVSFISSLLVLKYFHYKGYRLAFATGMMAALSAFSFAILIVLILETKKIAYLYVPLQLISLIAGIAYATSLILLRTENKHWLKIAGSITLIVELYLFSTIWAFHGEKDNNVPVSGSRNMIEAIRKAGGQPIYTEFPNEGHGIWNQVCTTPGLWDWLFTQKRD